MARRGESETSRKLSPYSGRGTQGEGPVTHRVQSVLITVVTREDILRAALRAPIRDRLVLAKGLTARRRSIVIAVLVTLLECRCICRLSILDGVA